MRRDSKIVRKLSKYLSNETKNRLINVLSAFQLHKILFYFTFGRTSDRHDLVIHAPVIYSTQNRKQIDAVEEAFKQVQGKKNYPAPFRLRFLNGMSGQAYRGFINSLIANLENPTYLEIGIYRGSTLCSAMYRNRIRAIAIDNWSEFSGPIKNSLKNIMRFVGKSQSLSVIDSNFREFDFQFLMNSVDLYFFDGPHSETDHYEGARVLSKIAKTSVIFIVDDWNWEAVRRGTIAGITDSNFQISYQTEVFTSGRNFFRYSRWHNGYTILVLERQLASF